MQTHTPETAPAASLDAFNSLISAFGWSPNVLGVFAGSPVLIQSYQALSGIINSHSRHLRKVSMRPFVPLPS